jgi:diguanylate cyclase (GGDEF)-like protein
VGTTSVRGLLSFLLPGGLLLTGSAIFVQQPDFPRWLDLLEAVYPYSVFAIAVLLGWRFDQNRLVFAAMAVGIAERALTIYSPHDFVGRITFDAVAMLLPLNLAVLSLVRDRGLFTWHGLMRWALILAQPFLISLLLDYHRFDWLGIFDARIIPWAALGDLPVEQPALLAFVIAIAITGVKSFYSPAALNFGLFWAVLLLGFAFLSADSPALFSFHLSTALLILVIAVVETSYGMAFKDDLTGLPGRRALELALLKLGNRYTMAMLDIDHFKKFNDKHGHDVGDQVLRMVATHLSRAGGGGRAYRYGGEEFTVLFSGKTVEDARPHAEALRKAIESAEFVIRGKDRPKQKPEKGKSPARKGGNTRVTVTVSIGLAERSDAARLPTEVMKSADKALYRAKRGGRNRVAT